MAAQSNYIASHREGGRFYNLNIIERLLPQGYVAAGRFQSRGKAEDGTVAPLADLCAQSDADIAIVGDGGIGKTTFLQHLIEAEFLAPDGSARRHMRNRPVPFFIELNRYPDPISRTGMTAPREKPTSSHDISARSGRTTPPWTRYHPKPLIFFVVLQL